MRTFLLSATLAAMTLVLVGCGETKPAGVNNAGSPNAPGVPTEGPEALKKPAARK